MKYNTKQRRNILARFVETLVHQGYAIDWVFARSLVWFDYDKLITNIHKFETEEWEYTTEELYKA